jgi:hypothetical protein
VRKRSILKYASLPVASAALVAGLAVPALAAPASPQTLSCSTSIDGNTGYGTCSGSGTWRVHVSCHLYPDAYGPWVTQTTGSITTRATCPWGINYVGIELG